MNFNSKNLKNLVSKDFNLQKEGALQIINNADTLAFLELEKNSAFIFDFIKEKVNKNLALAVNEKNVLNLFEFMKIYSEDFKYFIINSLIKFKNEEIMNKISDILKNGSREEKTYAVEFYTKLNDKTFIQEINSFADFEFLPLKIASIKFLSNFECDDRYNKNLEILKSSDDEFEKFNALEFLSIYGKKEAYETMYQFFISSGLCEIAAENILMLKGFYELILDDRHDEILSLYYSILKAYPESVSFFELNGYLKDGLFNYLIENDDNTSILLNFLLFDKLNLVLNNVEYSIDLTKEDKSEAGGLFSVLSSIIETFDRKDAIKEGLNSNNRHENILSLDLILDANDFVFELNNLLKNSFDDEIIQKALYLLNSCNKLDEHVLFSAKEKIKNEIIKSEIESYC